MNLKKIPLIVWTIIGGLILVVATLVCSLWYFDYQQEHENLRNLADNLNSSLPEQSETMALADLKAQQDMAAWAMAMTFTGIATFITSLGSVVALVWTFREQRKLTQNESRAYLEVMKGIFWIDGESEEGQHFQIRVHIKNNGETPATDIRVNLKFQYVPESSSTGEHLRDSVSDDHVSGELSTIPAKSTYFVITCGHTRIPFVDTHEGGQWYRCPQIFIRGIITYKDQFSNEDRKMPVQFDHQNLSRNSLSGKVELNGPHMDRSENDFLLKDRDIDKPVDS